MLIIWYRFFFLCIFSVVVESFVPKGLKFSNILWLRTEFARSKIDSFLCCAVDPMLDWKSLACYRALKLFCWLNLLAAYVSNLRKAWLHYPCFKLHLTTFLLFANLAPPSRSLRLRFLLNAIIGLSVKISACFRLVYRIPQFFSMVVRISGKFLLKVVMNFNFLSFFFSL